MIAVTGATGGVGSRAIRRLLETSERPGIVALARRPEAVPEVDGLSTRYADYDDPSSLLKALKDIETLVFVSSDGRAETMERHHRNVVAAAVEAGVGHVVYTSILDVEPDSRFYYSPGHRETERLLAASGMAVCLARTSMFADFFAETWIEPALASGMLALPTGDGRMSLVSRDDVGRGIASAALERAEGVVELTGPAALSGTDVCAATARATGRPLRWEEVDDAEYRERLATEGEPDWLIEAYASMFGSVREGRFATVAPGARMSFAEFVRA